MKLAMSEFIRFCVVGGMLFMLDAAMVELLVHFGYSVFSARIIALAFALQAAYLAHGKFTFRCHTGLNRRNWLKFMSANILGACINYGVFSIALMLLSEEHGAISRISAIAAGTLVALFFNYAITRYYVFKRKEL